MISGIGIGRIIRNGRGRPLGSSQSFGKVEPIALTASVFHALPATSQESYWGRAQPVYWGNQSTLWTEHLQHKISNFFSTSQLKRLHPQYNKRPTQVLITLHPRAPYRLDQFASWTLSLCTIIEISRNQAGQGLRQQYVDRIAPPTTTCRNSTHDLGVLISQFNHSNRCRRIHQASYGS